MSSSKITKKLISRVSSLSRPLLVASLCFLIAGSCSTSTYAAEREWRANTSHRKEQRINTSSDEGAPLLVSASDMEEGKSPIKTIPDLIKDINVALGKNVDLNSSSKDLSAIDVKSAEAGMNQVTRALEYSLYADLRDEIETELSGEGTIESTFEANQKFLLQQGYEAATTGPLSGILAGLVGQTNELQRQKGNFVSQIKQLQEQDTNQKRLLQNTLPVLTKVQKRETYLSGLNTKFKIALAISIPVAFAAGGGALYLFLHYWGR